MTTHAKRKAQGTPRATVSPLDALHKAVATRPQNIDISQITIDQNIQIRVKGIDPDHVETLKAILDNGGQFKDPVVVFQSKQTFYLADGFHRMEAYRLADYSSVPAIVMTGSYEDAVEYAETANLKHGVVLSSADKRAILERRFERGHEWTNLSANAIAAELGVTRQTVSKWIEHILTCKNLQVDRSQVTGADGRVYDKSRIVESAQERAGRERETTIEDVEAFFAPSPDEPQPVGRPEIRSGYYHEPPPAIGRQRVPKDPPVNTDMPPVNGQQPEPPALVPDLIEDANRRDDVVRWHAFKRYIEAHKEATRLLINAAGHEFTEELMTYLSVHVDELEDAGLLHPRSSQQS